MPYIVNEQHDGPKPSLTCYFTVQPIPSGWVIMGVRWLVDGRALTEERREAYSVRAAILGCLLAGEVDRRVRPWFAFRSWDAAHASALRM